MRQSSLRILIAAGLVFQLAIAAPTQETTQACTEIINALPGKVLTPGLLALEFTYETQQYWNNALRTITPACIVQPESAEDVSVVVKTLNKYPTVLFATRSGGHDTNPGHATVADGVLISMTNLIGATYDPATGLASVKPGGDWNRVIGDLEPSGHVIAGGRLGIVGVGGLLLQLGLSFLSAQEGMAADNIVGWETIMANGSIVNVDAATHPDLAQAMRGSGSQFGIVTKYTVRTHPIGKVWGGLCAYADTQSDDLYAALHNFVADGARDPKAAIIFTDIVLTLGVRTKLIFSFYDGPTPPTSGPFADFFKIPAIECLPRTQKYTELLFANGAPTSELLSRISFRTYTIPYIPTRPQMYKEIHAKLASITAPFQLLHPTSEFSVDFQPLPFLFASISESKGGNVFGLTGADGDRLVLEIQGLWQFPEDDAVAYGLSKQLTDWLDEQVPQWLAEAGMDPGIYLPLFMNDAAGDQRVTQSYRGYEKFKALQRQVDPNGLWSTRGGGFKY